MSLTQTDAFWYNQLDILWNKNRIAEFFPSEEQTLEERLNSIVRFGIYLSIILYFYHENSRYLLLGLTIAALSIYIYNNKPEKNKEITIEEFGDNKKCQKPTLNNPFMNVTMADYMNIVDGKIVDREEACDVTVPETKKAIDEHFNNNLYNDVNDIFGKMNSQRQFYTMPSTTIPNRQDEFAQWLYGSPNTCKENQDKCLLYEDLRANSTGPILYNQYENPVQTKT